MNPPRTLLFATILASLNLFVGVQQNLAQDKLRDLDSHCPFTLPADVEAWQRRAADLRLQLKVSLGLMPQIELNPVKPQIYGKIERDDYTIEKCIFESLPGLYVTGNLYRPKNLDPSKKVPGVLCPHGHWSNARFYDPPATEVKQLLATGAERFENAARNHIQARCVHLARMGCVVYHWDMLGYCDSQQINFDRAHKFANQPAETEVNEQGWLLFSPLAESHCQSILGLQTLAISRGVDMLLSLPEVDRDRIAITGASGGGTQSFIGAAVDERIKLSVPAVMVSTGMQGGCTCENACLMRIGTGNVEMAGLIAPRPLAMTAADDWTRTMPTDGFPELKKLYGMLGAEPNVALFAALHFGHNYNHVSRVGLYGFLNDHFKLGFEKPVLERDFELCDGKMLTVWDAEHPKPAGGDGFERKLLKDWTTGIDSQLRGLLNGDRNQQQELAKTLHSGWRVCLGLTSFPLQAAEVADAEGGAMNLKNAVDGQWQLVSPKKDAIQIQVVEAASPDKVLASYSPLLSGESIEGDKVVSKTEQGLVGNPRLSAAYTYGYNMPLFAKRARQLGVSLNALRAKHPDKQIRLTATGASAALATAGEFCAESLSPETAAHTRCDFDFAGFRFAGITSIKNVNFVPGAARFWDTPGLLSCVKAESIVKDPSVAEFERLKVLKK